MTQSSGGDGVSHSAGAGPTSRPWTLLSLAPLPPDILHALFQDLPIDVIKADSVDELGEHDKARVELVLADWRPGPTGLNADTVRALPRLAFVQQPSVGVQSHDAEALAGAGIPLANVAGFNAAAVTEWALGAALSVSRLLPWAESELRAGRWPQLEVASRGAVEIGGRQVGIVGFGPIGQGCARAFAGLGCPIAYWTRRKRPPEQEFGAGYEADLSQLLGRSEILINAIALGPQTRGLLGREALALLPPGALIISVSRGGIVDEQAVIDMLAAGSLSGAAFDVYDHEPLPADSPLRTAPADRLLLSPHVAGSTQQSSGRLIQGVVANMRRAVSGEPLLDVVNGVSAQVRRRVVD
ncbi:MAG TPA: NAD(P)-dependent oxidoreductase [Frankiaceae bacterium]|jgi:D-3-phosphoglycerate dehydrogenase|nr:NAD(P)-dependent oxidoreductase [Frankiaceae bacterium]